MPPETCKHMIKGFEVGFDRKPLSVRENKLYFIDPAERISCGRINPYARFKLYLNHNFYWLYELSRQVLCPVMIVCGKDRWNFVRSYVKDIRKELVLNIGAGNNTSACYVNMDIFPYNQADIVADAEDIPFPDQTVDHVVCETSLEHMRHPLKVLQEIRRILKPGGYFFVTVPFIMGYHDHPGDFWRWTRSGLEQALEEFEIIETGNKGGLFSGFGWIFAEFAATVLSFGIPFLHFLFLNLILVLLIPFKLMDFLFIHYPTTSNICSMFYAVARKRHE